jgi:hypothetical protein
MSIPRTVAYRKQMENSTARKNEKPTAEAGLKPMTFSHGQVSPNETLKCQKLCPFFYFLKLIANLILIATAIPDRCALD